MDDPRAMGMKFQVPFHFLRRDEVYNLSTGQYLYPKIIFWIVLSPLGNGHKKDGKLDGHKPYHFRKFNATSQP